MTPDLAAVIRKAIDDQADELYHQHVRDHDYCDELPVPPTDTLRMLALHELIQKAIGGTNGPARAEIHLTFRDGSLVDERGHRMPKTAAEVFACEADIWTCVVDDLGIPLDLGHTRRHASVAQRHAIAVRDGGQCAFPGCDQPICRCDIHHAHPWNRGGRTDLANLVPLCRHHHTVTHRPGWTLTANHNANGGFTWTTPTGRTLTSRPPPPPRQPDG
jgi:hypothetical protein